jgi:hypothetical protein
MIDLVDTEALRRVSDRLAKVPVIGTMEQRMTVVRAGVELLTAADELDRLRRKLAQNDSTFWREQSDTWKRLANDERDATNRLRAVIENAPHTEACDRSRIVVDRSIPGDCACWKADAL